MLKFTVNNIEMYPSYSDDLSVVINREGQRLRTELDGELKFLAKDFRTLRAFDFDEKLLLRIQSTVKGITKTDFTGVFYRNDGNWNEDDEIVAIDVQSMDDYSVLDQGLDKEFNLVELGLKRSEVMVMKRPIVQIYVAGTSVVSCVQGSNFWEQDASATTSQGELNSDGFNNIQSKYHLKLTGNSSSNIPEALGEYVSDDGFDYFNLTREFKIEVEIDSDWNGQQQTVYFYRLYRESDNTLLYESINLYSEQYFSMQPEASGYTGSLVAEIKEVPMYARIILDHPTFNGLQAVDLDDEDVVGYNRNYKYAYPISGALLNVKISALTQQEPTAFSRAMTNDEYFTPPEGDLSYIPIGQSFWEDYSLWLRVDSILHEVDQNGRKQFLIRDAYHISEIIKGLVTSIDPTLTHEADEEFSQFLYADVNPITFSKFDILFTQKSNLVRGEYTVAAAKALTTLNKMLAFLWTMYKLDYYVEDGKFKLEHESYFKNGGKYRGVNKTVADLTTSKHSPNEKNWVFGTNRYSFDKTEIPERIEFSWMDESSQAFDGYPVEYLSGYVERGKVDEERVSEVSTDVDYIMSNPNSISLDGFVMFSALGGRFDIMDTTGAATGYEFNNSGGGQVNAGTNVTKLIPVSPNEQYSVTKLYKIAFYDRTGTFLRYLSNEGGDQNIFMTPARAAYAKFEVPVAEWSEYSIVLGTRIDGTYHLPFLNRNFKGARVALQNGFASWLYLHPNFHNMYTPACDMSINGDGYRLPRNLKRTKKQSIKHPEIQVDPALLIKSGLGLGEIVKIELNLLSRIQNYELNHDPE